MEIENSVAIITGGASGLGEATVRSLHSKNCIVCIFDNNIEKGLKLYEDRRAPEVAALTKMMVFGYPYQYNHMPFKNKLFLMNFAIRLVLSKALPWIIAPPAFLQLQTHTNSYSTIVARARRTTILMTATVGGLAHTIMSRFFTKFTPLVYLLCGAMVLRELWLISM